jgi:hypothetical protein
LRLATAATWAVLGLLLAFIGLVVGMFSVVGLILFVVWAGACLLEAALCVTGEDVAVPFGIALWLVSLGVAGFWIAGANGRDDGAIGLVLLASAASFATVVAQRRYGR